MMSIKLSSSLSRLVLASSTAVLMLLKGVEAFTLTQINPSEGDASLAQVEATVGTSEVAAKVNANDMCILFPKRNF